MHFNFHLDGGESPEQSRRIANAVLALGGLTSAKSDILTTNVVQTGTLSPELVEALARKANRTSFGVQPDGIVTEKGKDPRPATLDEMLAAGHHVTQGSRRYAEPPRVGMFDHTAVSLAEPLVAPTSADDGSWSVEGVYNTKTGEGSMEFVPPVQPSGRTEEGAVYVGTIERQAEEIKTYVTPLPPIPSDTKTPLTDKNALPWDERIHSSSRAINADGTWRYRKNVPDETKRDVEAELRGLVQHVVPSTVSTTLAEQIDAGSHHVVHRTVEVTDDYGDGGTTRVPCVPAPPVPVPPPPAPPVPTGALQRTYSDVVNLIMARKVQPDTYVAILGMSLPEFAKHVISAPNDATLMFDALDQASLA